MNQVAHVGTAGETGDAPCPFGMGAHEITFAALGQNAGEVDHDLGALDGAGHLGFLV